KGGSLSYYDGAKKVAVSPRPYLTDAKGITKDMGYKVSGTGNNIVLSTTLPALEGLKYPITVDPMIEKFYAQGIDDVFIRKQTNDGSDYYSTQYRGAGYLKVGYMKTSLNSTDYPRFYYRAYLRFPLSGINQTPDKEIKSAKLNLYTISKPSKDPSPQLFLSASFANPEGSSGGGLWAKNVIGPTIADIGIQPGTTSSIDVSDSIKTATGSYIYYQLRDDSPYYNGTYYSYGTSTVDYGSSDNTDINSKPHLEINYNLTFLKSLSVDSDTQITATIDDMTTDEDDFHFYLGTDPNPNTESTPAIISTTKATIELAAGDSLQLVDSGTLTSLANLTVTVGLHWIS
ncbi:hypothetical protein LCGC14_2556280, partial [marine sediment metagenome]